MIEQSTNVVELRMLKWMSGETREGRIMNEYVRGISVASIVDKMRGYRLKWFGYVMTDEEKRNGTSKSGYENKPQIVGREKKNTYYVFSFFIFNKYFDIGVASVVDKMRGNILKWFLYVMTDEERRNGRVVMRINPK